MVIYSYTTSFFHPDVWAEYYVYVKTLSWLGWGGGGCRQGSPSAMDQGASLISSDADVREHRVMPASNDMHLEWWGCRLRCEGGGVGLVAGWGGGCCEFRLATDLKGNITPPQQSEELDDSYRFVKSVIPIYSGFHIVPPIGLILWIPHYPSSSLRFDATEEWFIKMVTPAVASLPRWSLLQWPPYQDGHSCSGLPYQYFKPLT